MINEEESCSIRDFKETDPLFEELRRDIIEKFIEYEIVIMQDFKDKGKSLSDYIDHMKMILWNIKDKRVHRINKEFGL